MQIQEKQALNIQTEAYQTRYCLYARKSSEEDERQALSIDSQIKEMMEMASRDNMNIVEIRKESHSAKSSDSRPVFNGIIEDIKTGMFNGILTWAPDRLSRNAGDLGTLVDLMDNNLLHEVRTQSQRFSNNPNDKFMLMILCSQAKLENDNKGVNVKRGLRAKCEMGIRPGTAPLGYCNEMSNIRGKSKILLDKERAPIVKEIFNKIGNEFWTGREVYHWLRDDLNFRTKNGKHVALSGIYRMLESTFYYGDFELPVGSGKWYKGSHEPLITKELFEKVRSNLISAPRQYGVKEFQFTKILSCSICGGGITATEKIKRILDGSTKRYVYYHCSNKERSTCKQTYIREEELLIQFIQLMDKIDFNETKVYKKLKDEVDKYNKFSSLLSMNQKLDKNKISPNKTDIKTYAKYILNEGSIQEKRDLLINLETEFILDNKKIVIKN